jgi:uncharacterized protein Yka (UPF0111/DUF47 family)
VRSGALGHTVVGMWPATKARAGTDLLALFEASARNVRQACELLQELLATFPERPELAAEVLAVERRGDGIAHDILRLLAEHGPRACSMESADVHALTGALDDIVDLAEETADQLGLFGVEAPTDQSQELARVLVAAADGVAAAVGGLRAGDEVGEHLVEVHRLENEADQIVRRALASLFAQGIDPMVVIRWKAIYDTLEAAVDACETVVNVLEGIALKRASHH